jgi:hypothetical protein
MLYIERVGTVDALIIIIVLNLRRWWRCDGQGDLSDVLNVGLDDGWRHPL